MSAIEMCFVVEHNIVYSEEGYFTLYIGKYYSNGLDACMLLQSDPFNSSLKYAEILQRTNRGD